MSCLSLLKFDLYVFIRGMFRRSVIRFAQNDIILNGYILVTVFGIVSDPALKTPRMKFLFELRVKSSTVVNYTCLGYSFGERYVWGDIWCGKSHCNSIHVPIWDTCLEV